MSKFPALHRTESKTTGRYHFIPRVTVNKDISVGEDMEKKKGAVAHRG